MSKQLRIQQKIAGVATLLFLSIALWIGYETRENVLYLNSKINEAEISHKRSLDELRLKYQAELESIKKATLAPMDQALEVLQITLSKTNQALEHLQSVQVTNQTLRSIELAKQTGIQQALVEIQNNAREKGYEIDEEGNPIKPEGSKWNLNTWWALLNYWRDTLAKEWKDQSEKLAKATAMISKIDSALEKTKHKIVETEKELENLKIKKKDQKQAIDYKLSEHAAKLRKLNHQFDELKKWKKGKGEEFKEELDDTLKNLQTENQSRFKPWQKNESLRRVVGLLHVTTGIYALVLGLRCFLRWLQLHGHCSQRSLISMP